MHRRELLGTLGVTAAALTAVTGGSAFAAAHDDKEDAHEKCADACFDCEDECSEGFHHCLMQVKSGKTAHAKAMQLCVDCADICSTSGKLVARMSPLMAYTCRACAECCDVCLAECEKLGDKELKDCCESLRKCSASCKEMVKAMGKRTSN